MSEILLGGKAFQILEEGTIRFDFHVEQTLRRLGLDLIEKRTEETPEQFADRLFREMIDTGSALEVVALFLSPVGSPWSPDGCAKIAEYIGTLTAAEDKARIKDLVVQAFMGFFRKGLASAVISRTLLDGAARSRGRARR